MTAKCGSPGGTIALLSQGGLDTIDNCSTISGSIYIHATGDIDQIVLPPSLKVLTGSCLCNGGADTDSVDAISAQGLTSVATDPSDQGAKSVGLVVTNYNNLKTVNFPNVTTIGSNLVMSGNPSVNDVSGFNSLNAVSGNVDITGNFDSLALPSLAFVNGSFNVQTTSTNFTCPDFSMVAIKGSFVCKGNVANPQPLENDNSTSNPSSLPNMTTPSVSSTVAASTSGAAVATTSATSMASVVSVSGNFPSQIR